MQKKDYPTWEVLSKRDEYGDTPLHLAVLENNKKLMNSILAACTKNKLYDLLCARDEDGDTLLHLAVLENNQELAKALLVACTKNKLYDLLCAQNKDGDTPLHYAVFANNKELIAALAAYPKDKVYDLLCEKWNQDGKTPRDMCNDKDIQKLLDHHINRIKVKSYISNAPEVVSQYINSHEAQLSYRDPLTQSDLPPR